MQLPRQKLRSLKHDARARNIRAVGDLLAHSIALGHGRLSLKRYFQARTLGVPGIAAHLPRLRAFASRFSVEEVRSIARQGCDPTSDQVMQGAISELMCSERPTLGDWHGIEPEFVDTPAIACGSNVSLIGDIKIGAEPAFGHSAVIRADGEKIRIGTQFSIGSHSTVHISHSIRGTAIGDRVSVGNQSVLHACNIDDDVIIGNDCIVLDGAVIGAGAILEDGSSVFPSQILKGGWVYSGHPAIPLRPVDPQELKRRKCVARRVLARKAKGRPCASIAIKTPSDQAFLASSATVGCALQMDVDTGLFFGCELTGNHTVTLGANSNVQDNTRVLTTQAAVVIGMGSTIGHNAVLDSCKVGNNSLVGIGSLLASGTVVQSDVFVAAGSQTHPGQMLESGWLWAGRPARKMVPLEHHHRDMISQIAAQYVAYGRYYGGQIDAQ